MYDKKLRLTDRQAYIAELLLEASPRTPESVAEFEAGWAWTCRSIARKLSDKDNYFNRTRFLNKCGLSF